MSMKYNRQLPGPGELKEEYPLTPAQLKARRDEEIRQVFEGKSEKVLVVVGPCSADREDAVLEYVCRLAKLEEQVGDKLLLIPGCTPTSPGPPAPGTRGCSTSPPRIRGRICWEASSPSGGCIFE